MPRHRWTRLASAVDRDVREPATTAGTRTERRVAPGDRGASLLLALAAVAITVAAVEAARAAAVMTDVQTQWPTLVAAALLVAAAPGRFGVRWGRTGQHLRVVALSAAVVGAVVGAFRSLGGEVPWSGWEIWIAVPVAEELLFRGFALTALLWAFRRGFDEPVALRLAIGVSAVVFALEHLGNLEVGAALVAVQVTNALAFGVLAGWLRVRTDSIVAPVLVHAVMNLVAVV